MSEANTRPHSKSRALLGIATAFVLLLVVAAAWWLLGTSDVQSRLALIRDQGLPTAPNQLNDFYAIPPAEKDATVEWTMAVDIVKASGLETRAVELPILGRGDQPPVPGSEWPQLAECRELLAGAEMAAARKAASEGGFARFPVDFSMGLSTPLTYTQELRSVGRLFMLDAYVAAHDGERDRVLDDVNGMIAASDALHFEPLLISQLVRVALRTMGIRTLEELMPHCQWEDAQLADLQSRLMSIDLKLSFERAMVGERAVGVDAVKSFPLGPFRASNERAVLDFYERSVAGMADSWKGSMESAKELSEEIGGLSRGTLGAFRYSAVLNLLPAVEQVATAGARAESLRRCACIGVAMRRHKLQHGKMPGALEELTADVFELPEGLSVMEVLTDPFDEKPLRLKVDGDAVTIYSVGPNLIDDGGDCEEQRQRALDLGFRVRK